MFDISFKSCIPITQNILSSNHHHSSRVSNIMETILGIKGNDFVMLAADCTQAHSIISLKEGILLFIILNSILLEQLLP